MAEHFILTKAEADKLRGMTSAFTALEPVELEDGTFVLPVAVLTDPAHAKAFADRKRVDAIDVHKKPVLAVTALAFKRQPEPNEDAKPVLEASERPDLKSGA